MIKKEPIWCKNLRCDLKNTAKALTEELTGWKACDRAISPEDMGYNGGKATVYIQKAIDKIASLGGGKAVLANGDYLSGTIVLKSNVCLEIRENARLLGSADLADYPDCVPSSKTVMDTHMHITQSLIYAENCKNIAICGAGTIDGQGTVENFPGDETVCETPGRPFLMRFIDCCGVHISGVTITRPACWTQNYLNCEKVLLENLRVESQSNYNNDGIDLDSCRDVIVRNCYVSSGDDALCFKGCAMKTTENVLVEDCEFFSSCNAVKIGTDTQGDFRNIYIRNCTIGGVSEQMHRIKHTGADSGISIEGVDGGDIERVWIENCKIIRSFSPFFIRLDNRGRVRPGDPIPKISGISHILLENMTGDENGPRGSYFMAIPEGKIKNVVLKDIRLKQKASTKAVITSEEIPEMYGNYPDAQMIKIYGDAPAYGLWARHAENIVLIDYKIMPEENEKRPEYVSDGGLLI